MAAQTEIPNAVRRFMPLDHVFGDARLPRFKPELEQFAVDARRLAGYCRDVMNLSHGKPFRLVHTIFALH